ncbi:N-acetylglucosamine-6-phosphate deacetylase [Paenibacillaceae bacterium]|nr:N-acetylglucosamine-6-phosphate deacetylase [Paenibacillaceae bacterium]
MKPNTANTINAYHYATGEYVSLRIEQDKIAAIDEIQAPLGREEGEYIVAPGLVDLQINGYGGEDFNATPVSATVTGAVSRKLWAQGVTLYLPTIITNHPEEITLAMAGIQQACALDPAAASSIGGIHLEGPFISPEDGARGAHSLEAVRPPNWELFLRWQHASGGRIRMLTMSPEWPDSAEFIRRCTNSGVIVSIGHTAASPEQIDEAVRAGARLSTHLGNGAHLMLPRHPNYLWEQLAQDDLWSCIISDGFHLPDQVLKVVMKVKKERALLVSDAVALSGMPPGAYTTAVGGQVVLTAEGKLHLQDNQHVLAGSVQMLLSGIQYLWQRGLATFADAWEMASVRPSAFLGLAAAAGLTVGAPADIVLLRKTASQLEVVGTYKDGQLVFDSKAE